jgi:hypothetical protein
MIYDDAIACVDFRPLSAVVVHAFTKKAGRSKSINDCESRTLQRL